MKLGYMSKVHGSLYFVHMYMYVGDSKLYAFGIFKGKGSSTATVDY